MQIPEALRLALARGGGAKPAQRVRARGAARAARGGGRVERRGGGGVGAAVVRGRGAPENPVDARGIVSADRSSYTCIRILPIVEPP